MVSAIKNGFLNRDLNRILIRIIPSGTMLTSTLRDLENKGLVDRRQFNEIPPHVEYSLSQAGRDLYPIFVEMMQWNNKHQ